MKTKRGQDISARNQVQTFFQIYISFPKFNHVILGIFQNWSKQLAPPWFKVSDSALGFQKYYVFEESFTRKSMFHERGAVVDDLVWLSAPSRFTCRRCRLHQIEAFCMYFRSINRWFFSRGQVSRTDAHEAPKSIIFLRKPILVTGAA